MSRSVVFVSPTFPSFRGNGLAMRAAATLRLLSVWSAEVHLLVIPIHNAGIREPEPEIAQMCRSWQLVSNPDPSARPAPPPEWLDALAGLNAVPREWQNFNRAWQEEITAAIQQRHPDLIVVFRFYLAPFIVNHVGPSTPVWLDVDEAESTSRSRLSHLNALAGKQREAFDLRMEALAYEKLEMHYLSSFERIFAASKIESECIVTRYPGARMHLLPNVYPVVRPQRPRQADGKARFLYVGTFGYYPNLDAVKYFCEDVLPRIRARCLVPVELYVIGSGLPEIGERLSMPGVYVVGPVPETTPFYSDCDVAIVPLRAAGGTRIKILEAFSHQRAVVSSSIGAEGLGVTAGVHLSIADSTEDFAGHCLRLIKDVDEREALAKRGHEFFRQRHTLQALEERLPQMFGESSLVT